MVSFNQFSKTKGVCFLVDKMFSMNDILEDTPDDAVEFVTPPPKSAYPDLSSPDALIAVRVQQVLHMEHNETVAISEKRGEISHI